MIRRLLAALRGHGYGHFKTHGFLSSTMVDRSGMPFVGPSTALHYTPVYRAASLIANDVGRTAIEVDRSEVDIILRQPNRWTNGFELRRSMTLQALLYGNAFAAINRTVSGDLIELLPLDPMGVSLDLSRAEPFYRTTAYGDLPISSVLHLRAIGYDGMWGESPVRLCKTSLTIMAAQETAQLEVMRNAGNPKLAIVSPSPMNAAARQYIAEDFVSHHAGAANAGRPLVLGEGMKVERIGSTLDDQGIAAARSYSIEDVSRMYGVPTLYLGMASSGNAYGSLEWSGRVYADACLSHWFSAWAAEIEAKLTPGNTPVFDTDYLVKPGMAEHMAALRTGVEAGVITRNEARARLDLEPLPGLDEPTLALNVGTGGGTTNIGSDTSEEGGAIGDFA